MQAVIRTLCALLLLSAYSQAAISLVQHAANESTTATTLTCSSGSPVAWASGGAGHLNFVQVIAFGVNTTSVSGNVNGSYTNIFNVDGAGFFFGVSDWYFKNTAAGDTTITVTNNAGNSGDFSIRCTEFSGLDTVAPLDDFIPATSGVNVGCGSGVNWAIPSSAGSCSKLFTSAV